MPDLATFQREFARALMSDGQLPWPFRSQAFAIYRNTTARGAVEALRAAYPTVDMLIGEEMFTEVALDYRRERPPSSPVLSDYGADFAGYLARQPWSSELPYLRDVARLDRMWLECFLAADASAAPQWFDEGSRIWIHPATRFAWLTTPAMTVWQAHRDSREFAELDLDWAEEGALFTRSGLAIRDELIGAEFHYLLLACAAPSPVAEIVSDVATAFPESDVPELLRRGVASGALIIQ